MAWFILKIKMINKETCNCSSNNKIRPNETCLFCCHKHLASALALTNESLLDDSILLRIASQIQLAAWHFDKNYLEYVNECKRIIINVLTFKEFKKDLIALTESSWDLYLKNKNIKHQYFNTDISSLENIDQNFLEGLLSISNAIELFSYENTYESINFSYVIGQLTLASWHFQKDYKNYSLKLRILYNKIDLTSFKINELIEFKEFLWKKYKSNFGKDEINITRINFE